eukprot:297854-Alexandrium_andersonii.AAC.1
MFVRVRRRRAVWLRGVLRQEPCLTLRRWQAQVVFIEGGPRRRPNRGSRAGMSIRLCALSSWLRQCFP